MLTEVIDRKERENISGNGEREKRPYLFCSWIPD
jgi:hypothetical protein